MGSTVLQIGNAAADIVGLPRMTTLVSNANQNAVKILRALKDAAKWASRDIDWITMRREHTFATTAASSYSLPDYFDRIVNGTVWDRTNYRQMIGPMTSTEWQKYKSTDATAVYSLFRIYSDSAGGKVIEIYPDTDTGNTIAFEYTDSRYVLSPTSDLQTNVQDDGDTFVFDDEVVEAGTAWRLLRMLGLNYDDEKAEYLKLIDERRANDAGAPVLDLQLGSSFMGLGVNIPPSGFGS
jgi:hypothetical protein